MSVTGARKRINRRFIVPAVLLAVLAAAIVMVMPARAASWKLGLVDAPKHFSHFYPSAIALDSGGTPHIVYGGDHLYHAFPGTGWYLETVDVSSGVGTYASVAMDSSNSLHIAYYDSTNTALKYATNASGSWAIQVVDNSGNVGQYCAIALDSSDHAHISYYSQSDEALKYATNASGSWLTEIVETSGSGSVHLGVYTSIALDSTDTVHMSYHSYTQVYYAMVIPLAWSGQTKYVSGTYGSWSAPFMVDSHNGSGGFPGGYTDIAVDGADKPHISYYNAPSGSKYIKYATNASGSWQNGVVRPASDMGEYNSIAYDPVGGQFYITYYDNVNQDLGYSVGTLGSWSSGSIDSFGDVGKYTSVAVDPFDGSAHVSYYDADQQMVNYATNKSGSWVTHGVDKRGGDLYTQTVGMYNDIVADSSGNVHISYQDGNEWLKYISNAPGHWLADKIDQGSGTGYHTSIAIDSSDNLHISYYDMAQSKIMYAANASGSWQTEEVATLTGFTTWGTSIAVDGDGHAHIAFIDDDGSPWYLRYATNAAGPWSVQTVKADCGYWDVSIGIDAMGHAHMAYFNACGTGTPYADVEYATNASGSWAFETVDYYANYLEGMHVDLALDSTDISHICYNAGDDGDLYYATNASGVWVPALLDADSGSGGGTQCSIALESSDDAHISYYHMSAGDLKYATNASGAWATETVDSNGHVGSYNSIATDSSGHIHISYYDADSGDLRLATTGSLPGIVIPTPTPAPTPTPTPIPPVNITVSESVHITDTTGVYPPVIVQLGESVHIADATGVYPPAIVQLGESVIISDAPGVFPPAIIGINEGITITDSAESLADDDGDGVLNGQEYGPFGNDILYDSNGDGVPDSLQSNVASLYSHNMASYISLTSPAGTTLVGVQPIGNPSPADTPLEWKYPLEFFAFNIAGVTPGGSVEVELKLPAGQSVDTYMKYGATPDNPKPHWYEFTYDGETGAEVHNGTVILHLVDGKRGDSDLLANGTVAEPGGPATDAGSIEIPALPYWAFGALGVLAFIAFLQLRKRLRLRSG